MSFKCFEFELTNFCVEIVSTYKRRQDIPSRKVYAIILKGYIEFTSPREKHGKYTHIKSGWYMKMTSCKKERIFRHKTKRGASRKC